MRRRGIGLGRTGIIGGSKNKRKPLQDRYEVLLTAGHNNNIYIN